MKIGILTYHRAHNFGAVLQAYALQEQLKKTGNEVKVIDYRPEYLRPNMPKLKKWMFTHGRAWETIKKYFRVTRKEQKSYYKYYNFINRYFDLSEACDDVADLSSIVKGFDLLVLGSDQIWNSEFNGNDVSWFGDIEGYNGEIVTYAVSAGESISDYTSNVLRRMINRYKAISVREPFLAETLMKELKPLTDIKIVLDPSIMIDPSAWEKFCKKPNSLGKYVLVYQARKSVSIFHIAIKIAKELDAEVISVDFWENSFRKDVRHIIASPSEFVSLIYNAECVVTTSFHGTAFSVILNRPFYYIALNDGADGRAKSLLDQTGLSDRLINENSMFSYEAKDFERANNIINNMRIESQSYLNSLIQSSIIKNDEN